MNHSSSANPLEAHYASLERRFEVLPAPQYGPLVVPNGNDSMPVHRWFRLKEAYSANLLIKVLEDVKAREIPGIRILDPFAGVGTTITSAALSAKARELRGPVVYGTECNPFLHLVGSTKARALRARSNRLRSLASSIVPIVERGGVDAPPPPTLSTFANEAYFPPGHVTRLMQLRGAIEELESKGTVDKLDIALLRVCLGASVEPASRLRRDGRTLRHVPDKSPVDPVAAFARKVEEIHEDLLSAPMPVRGEISLGDGRTLQGLPARAYDFDLAVFSPPYPNNIDYTEVYKLENWLLGFIPNGQEFAAQRRRTLYSHPSVRRDDPLDTIEDVNDRRAVEEVLAPLVAAIPADRYLRGRREMVRGYAVEMLRAFQSILPRMRTGASMVYIVGNSVHGQGEERFVIAADLILAALAEHAGFEVKHIGVARSLHRRKANSPFLRESVVFLERP